MATISDRAALKLKNVFLYNGGAELEDDDGINYYNTFYRKYDAQIGRFTGVDMLAENYATLNPYQFGLNNPTMFNDPMGDKSDNPLTDLYNEISSRGVNSYSSKQTWVFDSWAGEFFGFSDDVSVKIHEFHNLWMVTLESLGGQAGFENISRRVTKENHFDVMYEHNFLIGWCPHQPKPLSRKDFRN